MQLDILQGRDERTGDGRASLTLDSDDTRRAGDADLFEWQDGLCIPSVDTERLLAWDGRSLLWAGRS